MSNKNAKVYTIDEYPHLVKSGLASKIRIARIRAGLSKQDVYRRAGVHRTALDHVEQAGNYNIDSLLKIALVLGIHLKF